MRKLATLILVTVGVLGSAAAFSSPLPYATRTRAYDGGVLTSFGNLKTLGMAGYNLGLANDYLSSFANPSGVAMGVNGMDLDFSSSTVRDTAVQVDPLTQRPFGFGTVFAPYPWGFAFAYRFRPLEGQSYDVPSFSSNPVTFKIFTNDYSFSVSRVFFDDALSVGAGLILGQAEESAEWSGGLSSASATSLGASFGATYQFPGRFLLGAGMTTGLNYRFSPVVAPPLPGFFQPVETPWRVGVGLGWMPNRFLRADASVVVIAPNDNSALLSDESLRVGRAVTLQPKIGAGYRFLDYKELGVTLNLGTYLEVSRIDQFANRLHFTSSVELLPWVFFFGIGADVSYSYSNYIIAFGLNIVKAAEKLELVPKISNSARRGAFPNPVVPFDADLPKPLVKGAAPSASIDPISIGLAIPQRVEKKVQEISGEISEVFGGDSGVSDADEAPKRRRHSRRKHRRVGRSDRLKKHLGKQSRRQSNSREN